MLIGGAPGANKTAATMQLAIDGLRMTETQRKLAQYLQKSLGDHLHAYESYLRSCEVSDRHQVESLGRISRMVQEC